MIRRSVERSLRQLSSACANELFGSSTAAVEYVQTPRSNPSNTPHPGHASARQAPVSAQRKTKIYPVPGTGLGHPHSTTPGSCSTSPSLMRRRLPSRIRASRPCPPPCSMARRSACSQASITVAGHLCVWVEYPGLGDREMWDTGENRLMDQRSLASCVFLWFSFFSSSLRLRLPHEGFVFSWVGTQVFSWMSYVSHVVLYGAI